MSQLGHDAWASATATCDFAGSTVVHAVGGFCAMALAVILGPRLGKYGPDGKPRAFPAHNIVFVVTGTFILLFGWMGFNPGSTLGATDLRISVIAVNTNLAAVAGSATRDDPLVLHVRQAGHHDGVQRHARRPGRDHGALRVRRRQRRRSSSASSPGCIVCLGVLFNERVLKVDDPCGAISVHGYCGWFGAVCARHLRRRHLRRRLERRRRGDVPRDRRARASPGCSTETCSSSSASSAARRSAPSRPSARPTSSSRW